MIWYDVRRTVQMEWKDMCNGVGHGNSRLACLWCYYGLFFDSFFALILSLRCRRYHSNTGMVVIACWEGNIFHGQPLLTGTGSEGQKGIKAESTTEVKYSLC